MTFTRHGKHIPGTTIEDEEGKMPIIVNCEGTLLCTVCRNDETAAFKRGPSF